ncbi:MAG: PilZ domain-containing protein [Bacillota bacterium]|nr:PilZ domain-containing protein [Bacillota bacterium]
MGNKRRSERKPFKGSLHIDELYNQEKVFDIHTLDVEFFDISRYGVGFTCPEDVPLNCYFNARIELGNDHGFYAVLKVIRVFEDKGRKEYGCEFVGLADILAEYIDEYSGDISIS